MLCIGGALSVGMVAHGAARDGGGDGRDGRGVEVTISGLGNSKAPGNDYGAAAAGCDVTKPRRGGQIEQEGLRVFFGRKSTIVVIAPGERAPPGTIFASARPDGSIRAKVLWRRDRRAFGRLRVKAVRRPGGDRLLRARYDNHLGPESRVIPGAVVFPRTGCWHVTGKSGSAKLKAVVWVVNRAEARANKRKDEAPGTRAKPCPRGKVAAGIRRFLRAANHGSERRLERTIASGRAFRVYSQQQNYGRRPRNFFSTKDRDELIAQLIKRRHKGDRFRLRTLDLNGYDRAFEICNVGFTLKRRIGGGPWRAFVGKGALDQQSFEISVWNIGGQEAALQVAPGD